MGFKNWSNRNFASFQKKYSKDVAMHDAITHWSRSVSGRAKSTEVVLPFLITPMPSTKYITTDQDKGMSLPPYQIAANVLKALTLTGKEE